MNTQLSDQEVQEAANYGTAKHIASDKLCPKCGWRLLEYHTVNGQDGYDRNWNCRNCDFEESE